ncbi:MAG TPA: rhodanese-like domain-containing protein [Fulvivirga sp.]|nr:rhodanese-like domain-containing protein [Fulvivirga sp.]
MKHILIIAAVMFSCTASADETISKRVGVEEFNSIIENADVQLVDVRTPQEYSQGYIDDAINIDFMSDSFLIDFNNTMDKTKPVAIYCASGGRSAKALTKLKEAGYKEVYELGVGYNGYNK